jgi:hypothetical protein
MSESEIQPGGWIEIQDVGPRAQTDGIRTLSTPTPWGRSGRRKGIPFEGLGVMGAITKLSAGHESTWTFVVPNTEAIRGVPPESGLGNS